MRQDLDALKNQIEAALERGSFIVFRARPQPSEYDSHNFHWDVDQYADPEAFLEVAGRLGVRLVTFHHQPLDAEMLENASTLIEQAGVEREERRELERTLRRLHQHEGFTAVLEMTFRHEGERYGFYVATSWFREYLDLLEDLDAFDVDEEEDDTPMGGYFSQN